jgi:hypothetical protein
VGRKIIYSLILFLFSGAFNFCYSQTKIEGVIKDISNGEHVFSSVVLKNEAEQIIAYTNTKADGKFNFIITETGNFFLNFASLSYEKEIRKVTINKGDTAIFFEIFLHPKTVKLDEVVVQSAPPITIKNDTIIFNVASFLQGNEQVVEDLLKKLPGVDVEADGTIKANGKEVEKVMVEGDDFFEKGYKILTKNMPAYPIDKVELYQNYSNNKHLKGIENSDRVALNLKLKEDAKRIWFGNIFSGYGFSSDGNRYELRNNLMNFGKKNKFYFITNFNNIGVDAVGDINNLIRPFRLDEPASIGDNQSANTLIQLNFDQPNLKKTRVNLNNAELFSVNSIFTLSKKSKLKILGFFNTDENDFFRNSFQSFSFGSTSFENTENFIGRKKQLTGFGKIDFTRDIDKNKTFEYSGKINTTNTNSRSDLIFNADLLREKLDNRNELFDHKITYTNRFKDTKVLLLTARRIDEKTPQDYSVNQFLFSDLFPVDANNTKQFSDNSMQFTGIEAHLMNKKTNGDLLEIKLGNQLRKDNLNSRFVLQKDGVEISKPNDYQNSFTYLNNDLYVSGKYRFHLKKIYLLTQADIHQLLNQFKSIDSTTSQQPFFIVPKIGLEWKINEKNKILTAYSYSTKNSEILDVYPNFIQTEFRSFTKGTNEFNQLNASNFSVNYTLGNWGNNFFANSFFLYSKNYDFFSTNSIVSQNFVQTEKIIIKDRELLSLLSNIDNYFKIIKSNLKLTFGASKTNFTNMLNLSDLRKVRNLSLNYGVELRSGFRGFFNYDIGTRWNSNRVKTEMIHAYTDNMSFIDLLFQAKNKFNFQIQTERYYFGNIDKKSNTYYFMDVEARYMLKENKLTFYLSGNNLFNTKKFLNYSISDITITQTEYKLQPRYLLLKMEYRF